MAANENEEVLLRSVALQNAQSILLARRRAEEELVRAKADLEARTQELAHSLAMMRAAQEAATDAIIVTDGAGRVTGHNRKYLEMWRLPESLMASGLHAPLLEACSRWFADPQGFRARIDEIYAVAPSESEDLLELVDGRVFERFSRIQSVEGRNVGRVWIFRDITERRRAEAALQKQSEWLQVTLSSIGDGVIATDAAGRVTFLNPVAESLTGWTHAEAAGRPLSEVFVIVNEETRRPVENPAARVLREGMLVGLANHTVLLAKDGREHPIDDSAAPIRDGAGNLYGVVLVFRDIHVRKQLEKERERLLERETAARVEAENANRIKDEFLATLSHELRTPMNAIVGWVQMLRTGLLDTAETLNALETIERNAKTQTMLINDLLDISRIMSGKVHLEIKPVDPAAVVRAALDSVRLAAEAKGVRLEADLEGALEISGDADRLQQVVWNLLTNAVKFTPKGGRVRVRLERSGTSVRVTVADDGQGIARDFLPYVFQRFRQADSSTIRRHGGLGLGLAIVKQLVELHGGTVRADSEGPGRGAVFAVDLPLRALRSESPDAPPPTESRPPAERRPTAPLHGLRVLIVDDEPDARQMVGVVLRKNGAVVEAAASAREALRVLPEMQADVIVSDIGMPDEDGYSLIRRIRRLDPQRGGKTPAVALTAFARAEDREKALAAGFNMHVPKPVEPAVLLAAVAKLAGRGPEADPA